MSKRVTLSHSVLGVMLVCSTPSLAQMVPDSGGLTEIVVTAQRRSENLQDVPVAIAAIDMTDLANAGVLATSDLKMAIASLDIPVDTGSATPFIRGIGSRAIGPGVENPVAMYVDGVYMGPSTAALLQIKNIQRIEVLKGPQGTLFGRNATGGLIQIITPDPQDHFGAEAHLGYGNYQTINGDFYVTGPLTSGASIDFSGYLVNQGQGYGTNLFTGNDLYRAYHDYGFRSKLLLDATDALAIRISADFSDQSNTNGVNRLAPGATPAFPAGPAYEGSPWDTTANVDPTIKYRQGGVAVRVDYDAGALNLVSITSYRRGSYHLMLDPDSTAADLLVADVHQSDRQFSQEFQALSPQDSPLRYVVGLYYWWAKNAYDPFVLHFNDDLPVFARPPFPMDEVRSSQTTESFAPYAQATYEVLPKTNLTLGFRYTHEKRTETGTDTPQNSDGTPFFGVGSPFTTTPSISASKPTWRIALDHSFTDDVLGYVSYNRGFKSGGYSIGSASAPPYEPEKIDAYELGLKTELFDNRLRFNSAAWYYDYSNIQVIGQTINGLFVTNGARAHAKGIEFDFTAKPMQHLTLTGGYTYLHNKWVAYQDPIVREPLPSGGFVQVPGSVVGNDLPMSPHSVITLGAVYGLPVGENTLSFSANYYHNSGYVNEPDNIARQDAYNLVNASIRFALPQERFSVSVWGSNLTNEAVDVQTSMVTLNAGQLANPTYTQRSAYAPPRTYGITFGTKF